MVPGGGGIVDGVLLLGAEPGMVVAGVVPVLAVPELSRGLQAPHSDNTWLVLVP